MRKSISNVFIHRRKSHLLLLPIYVVTNSANCHQRANSRKWLSQQNLGAWQSYWSPHKSLDAKDMSCSTCKELCNIWIWWYMFVICMRYMCMKFIFVYLLLLWLLLKFIQADVVNPLMSYMIWCTLPLRANCRLILHKGRTLAPHVYNYHISKTILRWY